MGVTTQTELAIFGPYEIPYTSKDNGKTKRIDAEQVSEFWAKQELAAIRRKRGCYIFSLRLAKGFTPWYIGKATKNFEQEAFQDHKMARHYNRIIFGNAKGTPVMFFVAKPGTRNVIPATEIDDMETYLIQHAFYKNPNLSNKQKINSVPKWGIHGVVRSGPGKTSNLSRTFKTMMGI